VTSMDREMFTIVCSYCGNVDKIPKSPAGLKEVLCSECFQLKRAGQLGVVSEPIVKSEPKPFSIKVKAEIRDDAAVLNALMANADAFRAFGGSPLMLTEHVENGIDAIKDREKWKGDYGQKKIGKVQIVIDEENSEVRVIDDGTGIVDPIWILNHPLRSKKLGLEFQVGKYGRGLQGFRGFCKKLEYFTLRNQPHETEKSRYEEAIAQGRLDNKTDQRCVKLTLINSTTEGDCSPVPILEFSKYSNSKTGTFAIFSNWLEGQFEEIIRKRKEILERIQHHFRHDLENELIEISIQYNKDVSIIEARDFSDLDLYEMEKKTVYDPVTNKKIGTIEFFLYKCSGEYKHRFKYPFLLAMDNRPLQDSFLCRMPEFKDEKVWSSTFVTGYIKCDFIKPDNLRIALSTEEDSVKNNKIFVDEIRSSAITLKRLIHEYQVGLNQVAQQVEDRNIMIEVQDFLKKQKIKLDLPSLTDMGILKQGQSGTKKTEGRISAKAGSTNEGLVTLNGIEEVQIMYEKEKRAPGNPNNDEKENNDDKENDNKGGTKTRLRVKIPDKDGRSVKTVLVDPKMLSKGGRKVRKSLLGIPWKPIYEPINTDISYYDPNTMTVYVNFKHPLYRKLQELKKGSSESGDPYSTKQKNYILSRYLWELIENFYKSDEDKYEDKYEKYWELNHQLFIHKEG
jgi:CxxC-x17-CxxC domain-containing protein